MDEQTWYRLVTHLASQPHFAALLTSLVARQDGSVQIVLADMNASVIPAQFAEVLKKLMDDPATKVHLQKLTGNAGDKKPPVQIVAIIVQTQSAASHAWSAGDAEPGTLREAIDREWPW